MDEMIKKKSKMVNLAKDDFEHWDISLTFVLASPASSSYLTVRKYIIQFSLSGLCRISELRQRSRFAGFSLYISDSGNTSNLDNTSLCYKDGPQLPPLNFTTTCITTGQYVIFYNERLDGVTYPAGYEVYNNVFMELCEVQVNGKCNSYHFFLMEELTC